MPLLPQHQIMHSNGCVTRANVLRTLIWQIRGTGALLATHTRTHNLRLLHVPSMTAAGKPQHCQNHH
jgi:hypothetical protein